MLNNINLRNFKLHKNTNIDFGKVTIFIGPNNSGKSSVIHALQLLKKVIISNNFYFPSDHPYKDMFIDIEDVFKDICSYGENSFRIAVCGAIPLKNFLSNSEIEIANEFINGDKIRICSEYYFDNEKELKISASHEIGFEVYKYDNIASTEGNIIIYSNEIEPKPEQIIQRYVHIENPANFIRIKEGDKVTFVAKSGVKYQVEIGKDIRPLFGLFLDKFLPSNLKEIEGKIMEEKEKASLEEERFELEKVIRHICSSPQALINSFHFVYPIRGLETQSYRIIENEETTIRSLDKVDLHSRAEGIANAFIYNRQLEDEIYEKMKGVIDVKFFAELASSTEVRLKSKISQKENFQFLFEGLGTHQMLFMLVPIAFANSGDLICIEEPENHLHPKAQYELSKLLTNFVKEQGKQIVITTHSEHIIFGFLNQVTKKQLNKEDVAIYYFKNRDGKAEVKRLNVNESGQIDGGLPGFFEAEIDELLDALG